MNIIKIDIKGFFERRKFIKDTFKRHKLAYTDDKDILFIQTLSTGFQGTPPELSINTADTTTFNITPGVVEIVDNSVAPGIITIVNLVNTDVR